MEKLKKYSYLLSIILCLLSFIWFLKVLFLGLYPDFSAYYHVSKFFLEGVNYYAHPELLSISYSYPPIDFLLFIPLTYLPFQVAEIFWTVLNIGLMVNSIYYLTRIFSEKFFSKMNLLLLTLVFISFPTKFTLGMGQLNIFVLWIMIYGLWLMKKKKLYLSGLVLGAALSVKFSPVFLPVYFILKFNRKILIGMCIFALINILLVMLFVPFSTTYYYVVKIAPDFFLSSWKLDYYNQSLAGVIGRSFGMGVVATILKNVISIGTVAWSFYIIYKNKKKDVLVKMLSIGIIITLSILINTFSWQHHFVWLIIPYYASFFYIQASKKIHKKIRLYTILFISYFLVSINFPNPNILPVILQSHVFYGGLILLIFDLYLLTKK